MKILITGAAGFIGFSFAKYLLEKDYKIIGLDNLNDYYDPELKYARLLDIEHFARISNLQNEYHFYDVDISNVAELNNIFAAHNFNGVVNLAAQAGVKYSIENPRAYIDSNLVGFSNILECCRQHKVEHLLFASSSSVYGMNQKQPFSTSDNTDFPISLYAAKKSLMNCWRILIAISSIYLVRGCAFLQCMARLDVLTWHTLSSLKR